MSQKYNLHLKGYVGDGSFDPDYVDYIVGRNEGKQLNVLIDSRGGSLAAGLSVSAAFRRHGDVHVHFVGLNASAATIASMGAKHVSIDRAGMYLVHKASMGFFDWSSKNADQFAQLIADLEKVKADLDKIDLNVAGMYAARCKKDTAALLELMGKGGWLTPQEALDWGFVDEITDYKDDKAPVLDDAAVAAFVAEGVPVPQLERAPAAGALERLIEAATKFFSRTANFSSKAKTYMNKTYKALCTLLACESIVLTDNSASMSDTELQTIEDRLTADAARIAELEAEVAELKKQPAGGSGKQVIDNKKDVVENSAAADYANTMRAARELYNQV